MLNMAFTLIVIYLFDIMFIIVYNYIKVVIKISNYYCKDDWKLKVYKPKSISIDFRNSEWTALRAFIHIQQKGECLMCEKKIPVKKLTIHHIMPRSNGGGDNIENLIGLCDRCHNIAEMYGLDRHDIQNYYNHSNIKEKDISPENDWHCWVYGGYRRPE